MKRRRRGNEGEGRRGARTSNDTMNLIKINITFSYIYIYISTKEFSLVDLDRTIEFGCLNSWV